MTDWLAPDENWPPLSMRDLNPVVDVEDLSMMQMQLDNGVFASYEQCHFTPDYWRNCTVIGTEGRLENFGDSEGAVVKVWNRRSDYRADADITVAVQTPPGTHGGADPVLAQEFLRFIAEGGTTVTSPAAREAVAAGYAATVSLRSGGQLVEVPPPDPATAAYFDGGQARPPGHIQHFADDPVRGHRWCSAGGAGAEQRHRWHHRCSERGGCQQVHHHRPQRWERSGRVDHLRADGHSRNPVIAKHRIVTDGKDSRQ